MADMASHFALVAWAKPRLNEWARQAEEIDLSGLWSREPARNVGVEAALLARGQSTERAKVEASRPFLVRWQRVADQPSSWEVITYGAQAGDADRTLVYPLGDWVETYVGHSTLHGSSEAGEGLLVRTTGWLAEPPDLSSVEGPPTCGGHDGLLSPRPRAAHTTWTSRRNGSSGEIVRRFLDVNNDMVVRRTLLRRTPHGYSTRPLVWQEVFVRVDDAHALLKEEGAVIS